MTHSVKGSKLIMVDFQSWDFSFVTVGISFRSASCILAPTFQIKFPYYFLSSLSWFIEYLLYVYTVIL